MNKLKALGHAAMLLAALMLATLGGFAPARASQGLPPLVQPIAMLDDEGAADPNAGSSWSPNGEAAEAADEELAAPAVEETAQPDQDAVVLDRPVLSDDELPEDIEDDGGGNWWDQNRKWVLPLAIAIVATPVLIVGAYFACVCCIITYYY